MSGSRWVITPSWLWVVKIFSVEFLRVLLPPLNIFCFCQVHTISVHYWAHLCMKCSLGISDFLEEISSLSHSICFPLFLCIFHFRKAFLSLLAILWNSGFKWVCLSFSPLPFTSLLSTATCEASSDNHFALCISFPWGWSWSLPPIQCHEPPSTVLQALCLWDLIPWIYLSLPHCIIVRDLI